MKKIDLKDKKILYQLDINSRQSSSQIAKKVGLTKKVVTYRIKRLKEVGIIKNFYTVIDAFKLGYISFRFYLVLQNMAPEIEEEIINYFVENKNTWWITKIEGRRFDLVVIIWVREINAFYSFWEKTLLKYKNYFAEQEFSIYTQLALYRYSFLLDDFMKEDRAKFEITGGGKKVECDELDFKILRLIATNARIPTTDIAKKLNISTNTVQKKIKNLFELDVIQAFRVNIDYIKFGYQFYKVDIELNDYQKIHQIINYIKTNPYLTIIEKSVGYEDLELRFHVRDLNHLHLIMKDITVNFPGVIKNYKYFYTSEIYKINYMPGE
jgi:Lrp/AsnC family transcriptional regulator for asnA, asnC and gidA